MDSTRSASVPRLRSFASKSTKKPRNLGTLALLRAAQLITRMTMKRLLPACLLFFSVSTFSSLWAQELPKETGNFRQPDLVELVKLDPSLKLDIRYATANNFVGRPVYQEARAFLQRPAAEALLIFDGYRPWAITKLFWEVAPADKRNFVANPTKGSKHNRGCAVDLSLYDLKTGQEVEMPSGYDEFSERAYPAYKGGTAEQRRMREVLRRAMEAEGFRVNEYEWWHFDYQDWPRYPILNVSFAELDQRAQNPKAKYIQRMPKEQKP
jgi:zinc D-Ala-D-Ala dipeptidase